MSYFEVIDPRKDYSCLVWKCEADDRRKKCIVTSTRGHVDLPIVSWNNRWGSLALEEIVLLCWSELLLLLSIAIVAAGAVRPWSGGDPSKGFW